MQPDQPPRIEEIRTIVARKATLDRLLRWVVVLFLAACAGRMVQRISMAVYGTEDPSLIEGAGSSKTVLGWVGAILADGGMSLGILLSTWYTLRMLRLAGRFRDCLRDEATRDVPPLDGEVIAGLRCVESTPDRTRWAARRSPRLTMLAVCFVALVIFMPSSLERALFGGETGWSDWDWSNWWRWLPMLSWPAFVGVTLFTVLPREVTLDRGPNGRRIRVMLAGVLSSRTIEVPAPASRAADRAERTAPNAVRGSSSGTVRGIPLAPAFNEVAMWQHERLRRDLERRLLLEPGGSAASR